MKAIETQVGGDHYKDNGVQPLEATLANFGYEGLRASVYTKVLKYLTRDKGSHIEDIKKAIHCLEIQLEAAQAEENSTALSVLAEDSVELFGKATTSENFVPRADEEGWIDNTSGYPEGLDGNEVIEGRYAWNISDNSIVTDNANQFNWPGVVHWRIKNTGDNKVDG